MRKFWQKFIEAISVLIISLPMRLQIFFGDILGFVWFDVLRIRRRVALENLARAFPDMPYENKVRIARASVSNIGRTIIEFWRIPALNASRRLATKWQSHFHVEGEEHLRAVLSRGRGAFLLTAHFGNGDWATVGLALKGIHIHVISKEMKWKALNDFWFSTRQGLGTQFISDRGSSLAILKTLKRNQIIAFMLDQFLGPPIGIKTRFFGHETGTAMGLALLAGRSGAGVVPTYTIRDDDGSTRVVFEPEIPFVESAQKDDTVQEMTQRYCDKIEEWVRKYPLQWMWVHRRWKRYKH